MRSTLMWGLALAFALASSAPGALMIEVGDYSLQPNLAGQAVDIYVTGGDEVQGVNFYVEVGAGGPPIQDLVIFDDAGPKPYIFDYNNTGTTDLDGPHPDLVPLWEVRSTTTIPPNSVSAAGLLATIVFDTTGISGGGPWALTLSPSEPPETDLPPAMPELVSGTVRIAGAPLVIPEPSTLFIWSLLAGLGIGLGWWRRRR